MKGWINTHKRKDMILWQKGEPKENPLHMRDRYIRVQEHTTYVKKEFGYDWEVDSSDKINPETVYGRSISFKTKEKALAFARKWMRNH